MFSAPLYPYATLDIDCTWRYWLQAVRRTLYSRDNPRKLSILISRHFSSVDNVITCLSVRTAYDLYLQSVQYPRGSEIIMSAINIPEMSRIARFHGLIPVPLDVNIDTLEPDLAQLEGLITPKTRMVIISMIFGIKISLENISKITRKYGLVLFEDCAESYGGGSGSRGDPYADISVYSFGPIKHATAFGGGVMIIRNNEEVLNRMRYIHDSYPVQPTILYLKKLLKYTVGMLVSNNKVVNTTIRVVFPRLKIDLRKTVLKLLRGFNTQLGLDVYRLQPSVALLSFLHYRLSTFNEVTFNQKMVYLREATKLLTENGVIVPGHANLKRLFWLYPIITKDPRLALDQLIQGGIDGYIGVSQLTYVPAPVGSSFEDPKNAKDMFEHILYLPLLKNVEGKYIKIISEDVARILSPKL